MSSPTVHVALAILYHQGQFLLQLRDDISSIHYPAHWGLFGGHVEPGETPDDAIQRELMEEICYVPPLLSEFRRYTDSGRVRHVYHARLAVDINQLVLQEGWDLALLTPDQIRQGNAYSVQAARLCPLAPPPQQILLDFLDQS